jgi:hypothetical protein
VLFSPESKESEILVETERRTETEARLLARRERTVFRGFGRSAGLREFRSAEI